MEVGGWVQSSLGLFFENHPKIPLNQYRYFGEVYHNLCIMSVYTLLKVVNYYELSVLSMSLMGFPKKIGWGVGGWVGFWIFGICLTLQSP